MDDVNVKAMLEFIIPRLVRLIAKKQDILEKEALALIYRSELYSQMEREETKLWHLSVPTLYELWLQEQQEGTITYPEEA